MKVIWVKKVEEDLVEVRIEATKRRKIWLKLIGDENSECCFTCCPLYRSCMNLPSPLKKYDDFCEFCEHLFSDYPDLHFRLATEYGITSLNQTVPIKKNRKVIT